VRRGRGCCRCPEDRCEGLLADAVIVRVKLSELRLSRPRQWGACWLALMLWPATAARSVLVEAAGVEPQKDALGSGPARPRRLPLAGAGQRLAAAPRVVSAQCPGRSVGRRCGARRDPQAVPLSRISTARQAGRRPQPSDITSRPGRTAASPGSRSSTSHWQASNGQLEKSRRRATIAALKSIKQDAGDAPQAARDGGRSVQVIERGALLPPIPLARR
jgi:hypothetical protein